MWASCKKKIWQKNYFFASLKSTKKGVGSVCQRYGFGDLDPDTHQNVTDPPILNSLSTGAVEDREQCCGRLRPTDRGDPPAECEYIANQIPLPEFIDPVFTKTSPKRSSSLNRKRAFWLVFAKTGSIISGTCYKPGDQWKTLLIAGPPWGPTA